MVGFIPFMQILMDITQLQLLQYLGGWFPMQPRSCFHSFIQWYLRVYTRHVTCFLASVALWNHGRRMYDPAPVRVTTIVMKHHNQCNLGCFGLYCHINLHHLKKIKTRTPTWSGTWRQEVMQRSWKTSVYLHALRGLLSLSYRNQDHYPSPNHNGLGSPSSITN